MRSRTDERARVERGRMQGLVGSVIAKVAKALDGG